MSKEELEDSTKLRHILISTDANYLHKAVVLYKSLADVHDNFLLHVCCFDETSLNTLRQLDYQRIRPYLLSDIETDELLNVKGSKTKRYEYYWACKAFITRKLLLEQQTNFITFCDCDLFFFQSPEALFAELEGADVLIQPNNFSFQYETDFTTIGYYCSSFQSFRKNENSKQILDTWHRQTMQRCSSSVGSGIFGDQQYMDEWRICYQRVREAVNPGANVAPWNVQKFDLTRQDSQIMINGKFPLIYYHYHAFRMDLRNYQYIITGDRDNEYPIAPEVVKLVYEPYIAVLRETIQELKMVKDYREYVKVNPEGIQLPFNHETAQSTIERL
jgi:hypothetical protein